MNQTMRYYHENSAVNCAVFTQTYVLFKWERGKNQEQQNEGISSDMPGFSASTAAFRETWAESPAALENKQC